MARQTPHPVHPSQANKLCHQLALTSPTRYMLPRKFTTRTTSTTLAAPEPWIEQDLNGGKLGKRRRRRC